METSVAARILSGQTQAADAGQAVRELHARIGQPDAALVVVFCASSYPRDALAEALAQHFGDVPVIGCTTAGELGENGYQTGGLSGFSLPADGFSVATTGIDSLPGFDVTDGRRCVEALHAQLSPTAGPERFALLLVDGLMQREEPVAYALQRALGRTPLVGGSAGDGLSFGDGSQVLYGGTFHAGGAVLALVGCRRRCTVFKSQHFSGDTERLVVTDAEPQQRCVRELNGRPAAQEYARLIGVPVDSLSPETFAAAPVVVVIDGTDYVRSIRQANADGSLTFFCAIEIGLVLRVAQALDMVEHFDATMDGIRGRIGEPELVIGFDCVLRRLEAQRKHCEQALGQRFRRWRLVGFSTYGEQYTGVHINHTLTGVAIGGGRND